MKYRVTRKIGVMKSPYVETREAFVDIQSRGNKESVRDRESGAG